MASRAPNSSHELSKPANTGVVTHLPAPSGQRLPAGLTCPRDLWRPFVWW